MSTFQGSGGLGADRLYDYSWAGPFVASADVGNPVTIPAHIREVAFQVGGTFGSSGAISLEGSNDNVLYTILKDPSGTAITATDGTIWKVVNPPKYVKPVATAGTGAAMVPSLHGSAEF